MSLPTGWTAMPTTADHSADILSYTAGSWQWSGGNTAILGTSNGSGTGKFGFLVYRNIVGNQGLGVNEKSSFVNRVRWQIIVTNPSAISDCTLPRLQMELYALSWATVNPLPLVGSSFFGGRFGTITGASNLTFPQVSNIQFEQEDANVPEKWIVTYTLSPAKPVTRPTSNEKPPLKPNIDEAPWLLGPQINIDFGTEDFVLGLGSFIGAKTPAELGAALDDGSYAAEFGATGTIGMVSNSAGDPLESPPPMKVGTANININRAFESLPTGLASAIKAARKEVCGASVTVAGVDFDSHTCKLSGGAIATRQWKKSVDWLPNQVHPLGYTWADLGWTPPDEYTGATAINRTKEVLPAFEYVPYYDVSVSVASRDLGWGYALIDKGYRQKPTGATAATEITDWSGRQTYSRILEEGVEIDPSTGTSAKKVLRLYKVLNTGTALETVLDLMTATA